MGSQVFEIGWPRWNMIGRQGDQFQSWFCGQPASFWPVSVVWNFYTWKTSPSSAVVAEFETYQCLRDQIGHLETQLAELQFFRIDSCLVRCPPNCHRCAHVLGCALSLHFGVPHHPQLWKQFIFRKTLSCGIGGWCLGNPYFFENIKYEKNFNLFFKI